MSPSPIVVHHCLLLVRPDDSHAEMVNRFEWRRPRLCTQAWRDETDKKRNQLLDLQDTAWQASRRSQVGRGCRIGARIDPRPPAYSASGHTRRAACHTCWVRVGKTGLA